MYGLELNSPLKGAAVAKHRAAHAPHGPRMLQRGLSMLELMVGIVISLLVGLAATTGATSFLASQRQSVGIRGVTVNADSALATMRDEVAGAGLGFFDEGKYLCPTMNLSSGNTVLMDGANFLPVILTAVGGNTQVDVFYGSDVSAGASVRLAGPSSAASASVSSFMPAVVGQAVMLAPSVAGTPCAVRNVTSLVAATASSAQNVEYLNAPGNRFNQGTFATAEDFADRSHMMLVGDLRWTRFRLAGTELRLEQPLTGASVALAENVMAFRADYGLANSGATALSAWAAPNAASAAVTATNLPRLRAIRIGLVTRSPQRDKPAGGGACDATTTMPTLFGASVSADVTDWQCYRFKVLEAVVPLRNFVYGLKP